jgi:hypothetical protein
MTMTCCDGCGELMPTRGGLCSRCFQLQRKGRLLPNDACCEACGQKRRAVLSLVGRPARILCANCQLLVQIHREAWNQQVAGAQS